VRKVASHHSRAKKERHHGISQPRHTEILSSRFRPAPRRPSIDFWPILSARRKMAQDLTCLVLPAPFALPEYYRSFAVTFIGRTLLGR
jgi:hypothetical protein